MPTDASNNIDEEHNYPAEEEKKVNSDAMLPVHSTAKSNDPNLSGKAVFFVQLQKKFDNGVGYLALAFQFYPFNF